jgi:hypothetical protein
MIHHVRDEGKAQHANVQAMSTVIGAGRTQRRKIATTIDPE